MKKRVAFLLVLVLVVVGVILLVRKPNQSIEVNSKSDSSAALSGLTPPNSEKLLGRACDAKAVLSDRLSALAALPTDLTPAQCEQLKLIALTRGEDETIRNDALVALERQQCKDPQLGASLIRMWNDKEESPTFRDFTLQHMAASYEFSTDRSAIEDTLLTVSAQPSGERFNHAGTAMLSLARIGKTSPELQAKVVAVATEATRAPEADSEKSVVAFQVLRDAGEPASIDEARQVAGNEKALARLRMSAISLIGELGNQQDLVLLKQLTGDKESRVSRAAKSQLEALTARLAIN